MPFHATKNLGLAIYQYRPYLMYMYLCLNTSYLSYCKGIEGTVVHLSAGSFHSVALTSDGQVFKQYLSKNTVKNTILLICNIHIFHSK